MHQYVDDAGKLIERGHGATAENVHLHAVAIARHAAALAESVAATAAALAKSASELAELSRQTHQDIATATDRHPAVIERRERDAQAEFAANAFLSEQRKLEAIRTSPAQVEADRVTADRNADIRRRDPEAGDD